MSIAIDCQSRGSAASDPVIHNVPVEIHLDGEARVTEYFTTGIRPGSNKSETEVQTSSFRGRPLEGSKISVPEGFTGIIMKELHKPFSEEEEREFKITHEFKEFTSWNLDQPPSSNDKIQQALQWARLSAAVHNPVKDDNSPKSDTSR